MQESKRIYSKENKELYLTVTPGHFSSDRFHVNYYIDMSNIKMRMSLARAAAKTMALRYVNKINLETKSHFTGFINFTEMEANTRVTPIDTIICMDGCEVIGAYLAEELTNIGVKSNNQHQSFYVITPEFDAQGQMVVRDNIKPMIQGKNVLVVLASAMSGRTIAKSIRCITSYGGKLQGISVIFSNVDQVEGYNVHSVFNHTDLDDFKLVDPDSNDPFVNEPLDAIVNAYGYTKL